MSERTLNDLVQQAEQLSSNMDEAGEELPRVGRSLFQILQTAQDFPPSTSVPSGNHEAKASILLGSKGLDVMHIGHHLDALDPAKTLEPLAPTPDTDIAAFLRDQQQNAILNVVVDTKRQTDLEVQKLHWEQEKANWEQKKQKMMSSFTNVNAENLNITLQPQESLSMSLNTSTKGSCLSIEETCYVKVIIDYNGQVLHGGIRPNLSENLSRASISLDDQGITDFWSLVCSITQVPISIGNDCTARYSQRVQNTLIKQSLKHLEKNYGRHMKNLVFGQLERANLGGIPGLVPLVRAYLSVILPPQSQAHLEDGEAKGVPVWPLIFYCLRAGGAKVAAFAAQENSNPAVAEIVSALEEMDTSESGNISIESVKKLRLSYKRWKKNITDPFKRAVYCVLAHVDVDDDHTEIIVTTDDYLWLKLSMVDTSVPVSSNKTNMKGKVDSLSLSELQNMLYNQFGESHFNAFQQPFLYASVLLLTAQFEAAIEFLSRIEKLRCHAVHIALALQEMNLLALSENNDAPLLCTKEGDPEGLKRLNLVQLIRLYIRKFENSNPLEALHYCFFLRHLKGDSLSVFSECISTLVTESREFDLLLGTLQSDGSRKPGIVDKFKIDVCEIAEEVAKDSERKGLHEDAIKLYDLAKNHEKAVTLLNQLLSQTVHSKVMINQMRSHGSNRSRVIDLATAVARRFRCHSHTASLPTISTLYLLLDMATFFDLYHQDRPSEALEILKPLKVIALVESDLDSCVSGLVSLGLEVKAVIPYLLVAAMRATHKLYHSQAASSPRSPANLLNMSNQISPATKHLKNQARVIVKFTGRIPLRLNADVNVELLRLEGLIT